MSSWIKMRTNLKTDPKFLRLSRAIASSDDIMKHITQAGSDAVLDEVLTDHAIHALVFTALYSVWAACNQHARSGVWTDVSFKDIDDIAGLKGFGTAMEGVGWATHSVEDGVGTITFPNFLEWNSPLKNYRSKEAGASGDGHIAGEGQLKQKISRHNNRVRQARYRARALKQKLLSEGLEVPAEVERVAKQPGLHPDASIDEYLSAHHIDTTLPTYASIKKRLASTAGLVVETSPPTDVPAAPAAIDAPAESKALEGVLVEPLNEPFSTDSTPSVIEPETAQGSGTSIQRIEKLTVPASKAQQGSFEMHIDWQPTDAIYHRLEMAGKPTELLTFDVLANFKSFHLNSGRSQRQSRWEHQLFSWVQRAPHMRSAGSKAGAYQAPSRSPAASRYDYDDDVNDLDWMRGL